MKLIKSIAFILLSVAICYITWLIFYFITPWAINLSWVWMIVVCFAMGAFAIPLIGLLPGMFAIIISRLRSNNIIEKIVCVLLLTFSAFVSCRLAWTIDFDYAFKQILFAIIQNLLVVGVFWGVFLSLTSTENE